MKTRIHYRKLSPNLNQTRYIPYIKLLEEALAMNTKLDHIQKLLDEPTKWVGMYIATASAVCSFAMAADIFHGLRSKKFCFPCKYFSLNATFLALLTVAMKPSMDLTNQLYTDAGSDTKIISPVFMCVAMVNFMSSLGSMNNQAIPTNTIALGILALTIVGNMWIQIIQLHDVLTFSNKMLQSTIFIILMLVTLVSLAISVPNIKRSLELKYQEMHKAALREEDAVKRRNEKFRIANQREEMKKYWVMAETSSPQFVLARSVVHTASTVICLLATFPVELPNYDTINWIVLKGMSTFVSSESAYKWSTKWITTIQTIGIVIGLVAPILRWFNNVSHKCSTLSSKRISEEFKIENYWTQTLVDWRDSSSALQIRHDKCRKCFHIAKWLILNVCIRIQIFLVLLCKILAFLFVLLMTPFISCFTCVRRFFVFLSSLIKIHIIQCLSKVVKSSNHTRVEVSNNIELNLSHYVLLLEGESELPETTLKRICLRANKVIQEGKKRQPENLFNFLHRSGDFNGVREFDSGQVPSLHSQELPNCWSLPLVTLTTIAIALPNVPNNNMAKQLLSSVNEGMFFAELIDRTFDTNGELINLRKAANVGWTGVSLYWKWQDTDLQKVSFSCKNSKEILQKLSNKAKYVVREFKSEVKELFMENPLNWPVKVIAANSMYRICETILLSITEDNDPTEEELFETLSVMIADIFAACLTNLPHIINTMCHQSAIEKREKSVRGAFLLLGKTEGIIEFLQQREWPYLNPDNKALCIDEWRAFFQQDDENPAAVTSDSSNEIVITQLSEEEDLVVTVDS